MPGPPFKPTGGPPSGSGPVFSGSEITKVPREWFVGGYARAHDRFKKASSQHPHSPGDVFMPLFEALNWAGVLEKEARQPQHHNDPWLKAIRFVRNRVVHQWADAVRGREIIGPPVVVEWYWLDRASLPTKGDDWGATDYDALLANEPVRDALDELRAKF